jgi:hypothetical protein
MWLNVLEKKSVITVLLYYFFADKFQIAGLIEVWVKLGGNGSQLL